MESKKDISYFVDEIETIFQPFAYDGSWKRIEKLLNDYYRFTRNRIIADIKNGTIQVD